MTKVSDISIEDLAIARDVLQAYHDDFPALDIINKTDYAFMTSNKKDGELLLTEFTGAFPEQTKSNIYSLLKDLDTRINA